MHPLAPKIEEFRAKLRQHGCVRAALAVLIVCSCLAAIAGSAVVFECGARYITQANSIVIDAGSMTPSEVIPSRRPSNSSLCKRS